MLLPGDRGTVLDGESSERWTEAVDMLVTGTKNGTSGWVVSAGRDQLRKAVELLRNGTGGGNACGVCSMFKARVSA
jgi:hypothetical protein